MAMKFSCYLFKEKLERTLAIASWSPTSSQLEAIAGAIQRGPLPTKEVLAEVVRAHVPDVSFALAEGIDNSDLRALLALATAVVRK